MMPPQRMVINCSLWSTYRLNNKSSRYARFATRQRHDPVNHLDIRGLCKQ